MHLTLLTALALGAAAAKRPPPLLLAESFPAETALDDPHLGDAADLWVEMIHEAKKTLDIAQFYVVSRGEEPSRLDPVLTEVEQAAARGVRVRLLVDAMMAGHYPDEIEALGAVEGVEVRRFDVGALTGGILHAKYFLVDGQRAWLGSQNFDWRSLEHIQELGAAFTEPAAVEALSRVFELDWEVAATGTLPLAREPSPAPDPATVPYGEGEVGLLFAASPPQLLPEGVPWDLPLLLERVDGAKERVRGQWLSYSTTTYHGAWWDALDRALRRADARGVEVQLLVSTWSLKAPAGAQLRSLDALDHVEVRALDIPEHSSGPIDYARVVHSKYLVVDGDRSWVGTANASGGYFTESRNVSLFLDGAPVAAVLDDYFERGWSSPLAAPVTPPCEASP